MSPAVIDLSAHLLPGTPDGPPALPAALEMARAIAAAGTTRVVATTLVHEPDAGLLIASAQAHAALVTAVADEGIALEVLPGVELSLAALEGLPDSALAEASLGGAGRWLLVALPESGWPISLPRRLVGLEMQGMGIVLAHVEQTEAVQRTPDRLRYLLGRGALVQVDVASFSGWHGPRAESSAYKLMRAGMVTFLASGASHDAPYPQGLQQGVVAAQAVLRRPASEVEWMVDTGPRQVIEGRPVRAPRLVPVPRGGFDPA